ncbi:unnamed protein product, partial [Choristocarpus tenellus]
MTQSLRIRLSSVRPQRNPSAPGSNGLGVDDCTNGNSFHLSHASDTINSPAGSSAIDRGGGETVPNAKSRGGIVCPADQSPPVVIETEGSIARITGGRGSTCERQASSQVSNTTSGDR